jgi:fermentation-respiration switch protein FrsA (DUF1100 family)
MDTIRSLALLLAVGYLAVVLLLAFFQRHLQYFPDRGRVVPVDVGLEGVEEITLSTTDGETLIAWHAAAPPGRPTIVYFPGNGGAFWHRADRLALFRATGFGVFGLNYRGYGGSTGTPTEAGLIADALAAVDHLEGSGIDRDHLVYFGESLGSGVAVQAAAARPPGGMVLEAPFTSAADVAARVYWWLPARLLMKDRFDSMAVIDRIVTPLAIIHGDRDDIVPIDLGRRLFAAANEPKRLFVLAGQGHNAALDPAVWRDVVAFLEKASSR